MLIKRLYLEEQLKLAVEVILDFKVGQQFSTFNSCHFSTLPFIMKC